MVSRLCAIFRTKKANRPLECSRRGIMRREKWRSKKHRPNGLVPNLALAREQPLLSRHGKTFFLAICFLTEACRRVRQCNTGLVEMRFSLREASTLVNSSKLCWTYLLVYLTAMVGGSLHHHVHGLPSPNFADSLNKTCSLQTSSASCDDDDEDTCTLCVLLHQAQERAPISATVVADAHVEPALSRLMVCALPALHFSPHARAPPIA
jgi:hypothetical protein